MGSPNPPAKATLIMGMLSAWPELMDKATSRMVQRFGPLARQSETWPFTFSDYYKEEMGSNLFRRFLAFATPIDIGALAQVKLWTNDLEAELAEPTYPVARPINIDPGFIEPAKLVLASTKDHAHRIYIGNNIYAEITLAYTGKAWRAHPWTYPDYQSPQYQRFFDQVRRDTLGRLRAERNERI